MDAILNIFQIVSEVDGNQLRNYVNALVEHQSFQQKTASELESVTSQLTNLLNNFATKHQGLMLLNAFLSQCSLEVFEQKGTLWITLCTKICAQKKPTEIVPLAYEVLEKLIEKSIRVPEISQNMSNSLLAKILEIIPSTPPVAVLSALKCLETAMRNYPGPSGVLRIPIEKFIFSFVDSTDETLLKQAAKCLQLLQQVRGSGSHGSTHKASWGQLHLQIIGSIHEIFNALYANTDETVDSLDFEERLKIEQLMLKDEPINRISQLAHRLRNLCTILEVVLTEPFPVAKSIQPDKIVAMISRGLAVNCVTLSKNLITDNVALGALLPEIHTKLFGVLEKLIVVLKSHMLPYAKDVSNLVFQSLKWTSSGHASGFKRPYESIRRAAYQTLNLWCRTMKYGSQVEYVVDDLMKQILQDIEPFQSEVTLKVLSGSKKYLSKKARQKLHKAQNDATNLAQTHSKAFNPHNTKIIRSDEGNESICTSALNCLIQILLSSGCLIKPALHKVLQEEIVLIAISVVEASNLKTNLYDSVECRIALYGALYALIDSPHHLCPPPLQYAATIFNAAHSRDKSGRVRAVCSGYTRTIEKILHPQKEVLNFPLDLNEIRDAIKNGIEVEDEGAVEIVETEEHKEKVNTTNESDPQIDWGHTQFLVSDVGEVVEVESTQVSFNDDEELNTNIRSNDANIMEPQHIEDPPIKNTDADHTVERPVMEDDGLALDDELEEVSDLELDDDGDDYYENTLGIQNNADDQRHSRSPNTPTPTQNDYDEYGASRSKRQKLSSQNVHIDFGAMGDVDEEQDLHTLISHLHDDFNETIKKPSIVDNH
ncbi:Proline-, glutamic acid- and leucine-rich protein 1 [Pseudolycoriella hygida]|uniref:Proline-, glutamic acid- and leucine-rich protein 1 n=1 Tax=Pseudolycoriella hygida TaxID=35572 RepID=A0A9Q0MI09_9DIPT|nr:Proline-, glutamic acid- and leucine-rich protein 1 [Pseudolycoriella hygida]